MNAHDRLRRALHEALPAEPGFPSPDLLDRIMDDVSASSRGPGRRQAVRRLVARGRAWLTSPFDGPRLAGYPARLLWLPPLAVLVLVAVLAQLLVGQRAPAPRNVGRVEFLSSASSAGNGHVEFVSSQAQPANEYRAMTEQVLAGFNGTPDFNSQPTAAQDVARILYEQSAGKSTIDLVALTRSDMATLESRGALEDLTPLLRRLQPDRQFPQALLGGGAPDTGRQYFIPWLQATYLMVVNRQALQYLPAGADLDHLTYDELIAWGENMKVATGQKLIGLPADLNGPRGGLLHRFLQGYAYPSFTGTTLTGFRSPPAVQMWQTLRRLWEVTNDSSSQYTSMDAPLGTGQVWVAWDHQVRLSAALADDQHFVAVPAPMGPAGLGYMSSVVALAIPKGAPNRRGAEALIDWLTRPSQQFAASSSLNFSPVVPGLELSGPATKVAGTYQSNRRAVSTLLPVGLGANADAFNGVYQDTFARIVLHGEDIPTVLNQEAVPLQELVDDAGASCWPPDRPSRGPCQIG